MNMLAFLGTQELIIVAIIALVLFGGNQIPKLARNLGKAQKELQRGLAEGQAEADKQSEAQPEKDQE
ncbi:MAG: twin-arginine translocase TatA/TatE family subunit [Acidimicrobiales bacterium]|jgi:sec-independent protein translocase protein TatA|nr:twin-arginine translocase TatA/TatE family subunit [Acidimicrobiales bacterium]MDP6287896.1 twin-arginine translocase TatA/TatE family subunit [Acidimicrobiales bacterium]MDP6910259.1 twin-arginine translocase TatA/TatE family subunit [Acidimicrobiales bacterium]HJM73541.1 twin-arginine translocase TatA/TatE family subunit [Acidimicrobiales bacterium]HJP25542.1 twin-arginine translocase TatA/TatE family subunit [Acidimicrobiales bacterium]